MQLNLPFIWVVCGSILTACSVIPYLIDVYKGTTKPRIVSWATWSILTGISCAASFSDGQYASGMVLAAATLDTFLVVVLGFKKGDHAFERFDILCLVGVLVGLALWAIYNSPALAIVAAISIDFVGALPSLRHSWQRPHEETSLAFLLASLGGGFAVLAVTNMQITSVAYPFYLLLMNAIFFAIIVGRKRYQLRKSDTIL